MLLGGRERLGGLLVLAAARTHVGQRKPHVCVVCVFVQRALVIVLRQARLPEPPVDVADLVQHARRRVADQRLDPADCRRGLVRVPQFGVADRQVEKRLGIGRREPCRVLERRFGLFRTFQPGKRDADIGVRLDQARVQAHRGAVLLEGLVEGLVDGVDVAQRQAEQCRVRRIGDRLLDQRPALRLVAVHQRQLAGQVRQVRMPGRRLQTLSQDVGCSRHIALVHPGDRRGRGPIGRRRGGIVPGRPGSLRAGRPARPDRFFLTLASHETTPPGATRQAPFYATA